MTTLRKPTLTAATLMLAFAAPVALAQTAQPKPATPAANAKPAATTAGKTLGGNAVAGGS